MNEPKNKTVQKIVKTFIVIAFFLSVLSITSAPALGDDNGDDDEVNFIIPDYGYTVDYYRSFGEPEFQASIVGDPEFSRGETAALQVKIVNKGVVEGFKRLPVNQSMISDSSEELLALAELEEEKDCTIAKDISATLETTTDYIEIEPTTSVQNVEEIETGHTSTLRYIIRIDDDTPAGDYELKLPVSYEYQKNVRTATSDVINLGLTNTEFTREYETKNTTLTLPVSIKKEAKFEITEVSGSLKQQATGIINVTYKNVGEIAAENSMARVIVMSPLSVSKSTVRLGAIGAGESRVASFEISADADAVVKKYGIDSEIRFIDDRGETQFSENLKIDVPLEASKKKISMSTIAGIIIALLMIYQLVNAFRNKKKYSENASGDENE